MSVAVKFTIAIEHNGRTRAEAVERHPFDEDAMAEATDLAHEMLAYLERVARRADKKEPR